MSEPDLSATGTAWLLSFAEDLARRAGGMIRTAFHMPRTTYERKSATDPVTKTDRAVEAMIFGAIRENFAQHVLIGEESAAETEWTDAPTWIVDPIDGTANFVHRIPICAVSIGFTYKREFKVGVIYNPLLDELFAATHLTQSTLNGIPIRVSSVTQLTCACVATECGSDRSATKIDAVVSELGAVMSHQALCVRMMGSCALNMAHVACGRVDVFYERGPYAWDMAAGVLIVRQAGGVVCGGGLGGLETEFDLTGRSVLAFTPGLKKNLSGAFGSGC